MMKVETAEVAKRINSIQIEATERKLSLPRLSKNGPPRQQNQKYLEHWTIPKNNHSYTALNEAINRARQQLEIYQIMEHIGAHSDTTDYHRYIDENNLDVDPEILNQIQNGTQG